MHESLRSKGGPSLSCKLSHKTDTTHSYVELEGPPLLSIVVSGIGGSIQRSHVCIPYIRSLFKSTVLLNNLFAFGPLFISEFSTKFSAASLIDFVQRSAF